MWIRYLHNKSSVFRLCENKMYWNKVVQQNIDFAFYARK